MNKFSALFLLLALSILSCKKNTTGSDTELPLSGDKKAPDAFNYITTKKVDVNIRLLTRNDKPIAGVMVSIFDPAKIEAGAELTKVISDDNGYVKTSINIQASLDTLTIDPAYIGLIRNAKAYISNNTVSAILGGATGSSGNIVEATNTVSSTISPTIKIRTLSALSGSIYAKGTVYDFDKKDYDGQGRPNVLSAVDDFDFASLMQRLNYALPESKKVADKYIKTEAPADLTITKLADVWITFLHEGASYQNSLAYYTYPTGNAPGSAAEIDTVHLIFPNTSLKGSNGNLLSGDKVKLGRFKAGISIGFVLLQNAFSTNGNNVQINTDATKFHTNEAFNPGSATYKRHNVLLRDTKENIFLIGFEDMTRGSNSGSDDDFNDLVIYAQSNPVEAISPIDIPYLEEKAVDTDGDGVPDFTDKYPNDKTRAYDRFYPSESTWGTIAFEDMWPNEGDYDLNDLVVGYRYKFAMNADNKVVDLTGEYKPLAAGASFNNGFGVQLPLSHNQINKVSGYSLSSNSYIKLANNGLELGQNSPVFIPFDNFRTLFNNSGGFMNTVLGTPKVEGTLVTVSVLFTTPLLDEFTAKAPFNPFMISNEIRGKEVHMVHQSPTTLADVTLFGTQADDSKPAVGRYYVTRNNMPFALDIFGEFLYPAEQKSIYSVYFNFAAWAASGGKDHADWYMNAPERDNSAIYK